MSSPPSSATRAPLVTPVLVAGCVILMVGFGIRASFGIFQIPIAGGDRRMTAGPAHRREPEAPAIVGVGTEATRNGGQ
jgi:hypothetical protein